MSMSAEDTKKELAVVRLNDLVTDVFEDRKLELLVNILPNGKPMQNDEEKIITVGFFVENKFERYINVAGDSAAKVFMRCSEILYSILKKEE